ncbi:MAG: hypothetical protein OEX11_05745 [Nitrosomonas sp.]|nr:hypothetical protein [Nitrosomonas sp.]
MANFFTNSISAGASNLVEAVGDAIDKNVTTDEERKEIEDEFAKASIKYNVETAKLGLEEKKVIMADMASARENQSKIQESEHSSWLAKNVHSILAVGIIGLTFAMYFWIIQKGWGGFDEAGMKDIVIYILGALTTVSTQVAAYFFGSSQGSKDKQKALESASLSNVRR